MPARTASSRIVTITRTSTSHLIHTPNNTTPASTLALPADMMSSLFGVSLPGPTTPFSTYTTDAMHEELSRQMAASQSARRLSRGSNGQRAGSAMRVVKPASASNSPRSTSLLGRRRTLMNSGELFRRRQQLADQATVALPSSDINDPSRTTSRPVSWHPSSYQYPQLQVTQPASQYPFPAMAFGADAELPSYPHFSPTPAAYSCNTSPSATFSPLTLPYAAYDAPGYLPVEGWNMPSQSTPSYVSSSSDSMQGLPEPFPALTTSAAEAPASAAAMEWNSFAMNGFASTSPPTPQTLPPAQQPQMVVPAEEAIPYEALEEPEEEGEILVGMGLYDAPTKYESDPHLDVYRSTVSSLLGSTYRIPQATGKGLKLEESWQPPPESDDDEDADDDCEGSDDAQSEQQEQPASQPATSSNWI